MWSSWWSERQDNQQCGPRDEWSFYIESIPRGNFRYETRSLYEPDAQKETYGHQPTDDHGEPCLSPGWGPRRRGSGNSPEHTGPPTRGPTGLPIHFLIPHPSHKEGACRTKE